MRRMDSLKVTVDDMFSFWKHLQECCSTVSEAAELALDDINADPEAESLMDDFGVEKPMEDFNTLWKALKEVCTNPKKN